MTNEEYRNGLKEIEEEAEKKRRSLIVRWLHENRKHKDGEVIEDHIGKGHVLKAKVERGHFGGYPNIFYICVQLKKDGTPKLDRKTGKLCERYIYESNLKTNQ
jgi:hypothetical protein